MTEFQELVKDAPKFVSMERGELVTCAYAMYATAAKMDAENDRLRELVRHMHTCMEHYELDGSIGCEHCPMDNDTGNCDYERRMRELGVEVS